MSWSKYLPKKATAHLVLLSAQVCYSGWHIVGSLAMKDGADPFVFVLYRELVASALMYAYMRYCGLALKIESSDRVRFLILGFFSFVNVVGAMLALKYISPTRFAIFQPVIPCVATFISVSIGLERFTFIKAFGILLAVGGAMMTELMKDKSSDDDESNVTLGITIVTCQVAAMGALVVFVKPMLSKYAPSVVTLTYYSIGTVYTILLTCAWAYSLVPSDLIFDGSFLPWLALAYASTFATFYAYNALSWSGKQLSPGATTVYSTFQPVATIILSLIVLGDVLTLGEGLGAVFVIAGLIVTVYAQRVERAIQMHHCDDASDGGSDDDENQFFVERNSSFNDDPINPLAEKLNSDYKQISTVDHA